MAEKTPTRAEQVKAFKEAEAIMTKLSKRDVALQTVSDKWFEVTGIINSARVPGVMAELTDAPTTPGKFDYKTQAAIVAADLHKAADSLKAGGKVAGKDANKIYDDMFEGMKYVAYLRNPKPQQQK